MPKIAAKKSTKKVPRSRAKTPVAPASARGAETRARLLDAAYAEFRHNGYHGTSMRQIAKSAGVAVGGIYNHFHSKEEVFAAVLDARHPYHALLPALAAAQGETLDEFVRDAGRGIQAAMRGIEDQLLPLIFIEFVEFQGRHLQALAERLFPQVMGFAQNFMERPGHRSDLPLPLVMRTLISLMIGYVMTEMFIRGLPMFQSATYDWFDGMLDIYLHGIVQPDRAAPAEA